MTLPDRKSVNVGGGALSWRERGDGVALVLIHGTGGSSDSWAPQFDDFADGYRVIAWDAPGYGASDPFEADAPGTDEYARALAGLLDLLGVMAAHLVGHSIGAPIAASLCRRTPSLALSATFVHPVAGFASAEEDTRAAGHEARVAGIKEVGMGGFARSRAPALLGSASDAAALARVIDIIARIPERGYRQMVAMMGEADLMADAHAVDVPTLVLAGSEDWLAPEGDCRAIADALSQSEFRLLDNIGHYVSLENPALFRRTLKRFLDKHGGAAAFATY